MDGATRLVWQVGSVGEIVMFKYQRIVVPLDGSELAERAIAPAITIANAMTAEVILLTVVTPLPSKVDPFGQVLRKDIEAVKLYLELARSRFLLASVGGKVAATVGKEIAQSIIKYGEQNKVDLIIMSSRGQSGIRRRLYGSVTEKVLYGAPCATLAIREQEPIHEGGLEMCKLILLSLDGSSLAEEALPHAVALAKHFQAELILLRVLKPLSKHRDIPLGAARRAEQVTRELAHGHLERVAAGVRESGIPVQAITVEGHAHEEIVYFAKVEQVDLIVMCMRGHSWLSRWLRGSVADRVVRGASVPVLLVSAGRKRRKRCDLNKNPSPNTPVLGTNMESQSGKITNTE